jgi:hypothetical protein
MRYVFSLYFIALFFMGLFYIATTPVFEPFDEMAHYSSVRQIAYEAKIVKRSESFLDRLVVEDYQGPDLYSSGNPPFDDGMVYYKFFNRQDLVDSYIKNRQVIPPASFTPGQKNNWQSQHPPLYYALMAPVLRLVDRQSLITQVFVLRSFSFLLALCGVALGVLAIIQRGRADPLTQKLPLLLGFFIYPFMLPMFFPEFARIGNDSLCLFLVGLLAYLLSKWLANSDRVKYSVAIGLTLGIGLLTKALFVPIAAATFMFIIIYLLIERRAYETPVKLASSFSYILLPTIAIGGVWYGYNYLVLGDLSGNHVAIELAQKGGFFANIANTFSITTFLSSIARVPVTYAWAGTWSLAHLPYALYIPIMAALAWVASAFCLRLRKVPLSDTAWLSVWLIFFFMLGISWHVLINMAVERNANTPGYYMHILLPFVAPVIGLGAQSIWRNKKSKLLFFGLLAYCVIFHFIAIWCQLALYTGCAIKGDDKHYQFQSDLLCFDQAPQMLDNLSVLGYPLLGAIGFIGWTVCSVLLILELRGFSSTREQHAPEL